jgi:hypothetical protein
MFLTKLCERYRCTCGGFRSIEPYTKQAVGLKIDNGVQPISIDIEMNQVFIDRNVIWIGTIYGL